MSGFKYVRVLKIRKLSKIGQGSEYASGCIYERVLNILGFQVCQVSAYTSVAQGSEYAGIWMNNALCQGSEYPWSMFHKVLNKPLFINIPGLRKWQGFENARIRQGAENGWISLNML